MSSNLWAYTYKFDDNHRTIVCDCENDADSYLMSEMCEAGYTLQEQCRAVASASAHSVQVIVINGETLLKTNKLTKR